MVRHLVTFQVSGFRIKRVGHLAKFKLRLGIVNIVRVRRASAARARKPAAVLLGTCDALTERDNARIGPLEH